MAFGTSRPSRASGGAASPPPSTTSGSGRTGPTATSSWTWGGQDEQERIIGRTKPDSVELDDDVGPASAHISRTVIEDGAGEEREIWRRSTPFGSVRQHNPNFVGFSGDISTFDAMLARMFGISGDGIHDRLIEYSEPVRAGYYFAPSLDDLHVVFSGS